MNEMLNTIKKQIADMKKIEQTGPTRKRQRRIFKRKNKSLKGLLKHLKQLRCRKYQKWKHSKVP